VRGVVQNHVKLLGSTRNTMVKGEGGIGLRKHGREEKTSPFRKRGGKRKKGVLGSKSNRELKRGRNCAVRKRVEKRKKKREGEKKENS